MLRESPVGVKPVSVDIEERLKRMARLRREMAELSDLLAEGTRLVNRPHDDAKDRFVKLFLTEGRVDNYPVIEDDLIRESNVEWSHEFCPSKTSIEYLVSSEICLAFEQAGAQPPAIAHTLAATLLGSELGVADTTLGAADVSRVSVELVLAHIEALAFPWPKRVKLAAARRVAVVLLNRHRFQLESWDYDEQADEWEQNRTE